MKRFYLLLLLPLLFSACGKSGTAVKRANTQVLLISEQNSLTQASNQEFYQLLSTYCQEKKYKLDTLLQRAALKEDFIKDYSAIVLLGTSPEDYRVWEQSDLERYVQSSSGLMLINTPAPLPYSWPWYKQIMEHREENQVPGQTPPFSIFPYDNGRVSRIQMDSTLLANHTTTRVDLFKSLEFIIGENSYDYSKAHSLRAPRSDRFTKVVLDNDMNEPMELTVLPNGSVIYIERRGKMKLYDNNLKATRLIADFEVCTSGNYEDGLLGLALDPKYSKDNHYLYLYYSPPCDTPYQYLSRFIYKDDSLHRASEVVMLKVFVQRETCCHSGGSVAFGPDGLLYLSTGDNTSSKESDGFSPIDERPGRGPFDAQKSSGNTHDLRGKILRIQPLADGTYAIPDGNLFPKDGSNGRPEIYVMGARNPFRIAIDHKTNYLYWGDVGPDGGQDGKYGPQSYDEFNQAKSPGNYGWPYFGGNNLAYPDRDFSTGAAGPLPDPARPVNKSPYNTGDSILPPAQPAMIWYPYGASAEFPMLGSGGRSSMAGPIYYADLAYPASRTKFPAYYEGKLFIYEWVRNWIKLVTFDEKGTPIRIESFLDDFDFFGPLDMEFGPDGAMYMLEYGNAYFLNNPEAKLVRIEYASGNRPPAPQLAVDQANGAAPLSVHFSAAGSFDYDADDQLTYEWDFDGDGQFDAEGMEGDFRYENKGVYTAQLTITDQQEASKTISQKIQVGNQPPEVNISYQGNQSFYFDKDKSNYSIDIQDAEDPQKGGIDVLNASVSLSYLADADYLRAIQQGAQQLPEGSLSYLQGRRLIEGSDCRSCHQDEKQLIGPSYRMVAQKYKDQADAISYLSDKITKGGGGVWGKAMMSAHPTLSKTDATEMARYILSLEEVTQMPLKGSLVFDQHPGKAAKGGYILSAVYKDRGANDIPPISSRNTYILKAPKLEAEHADDYQRCWKSRYGDDLDQTQMIAQGEQAMLQFNQIDLSGIQQVSLWHQSLGGGSVHVRLDAIDGPEIGQGNIGAGTNKSAWSETKIRIQASAGLHDLYFIIKNSKPGINKNIMNIDWFGFYQ